MIPHIGLAVITFLITNIDDLLILSVYFSSPEYRGRNVVAGQFLGIFILILLSMTGVVLGTFVDERWISLLGLFPIFLGVKDLLRISEDDRNDTQPSKSARLQFLSVTLVTIANGGDNIGVYTPLFASLPALNLVWLYATIFLLLTGFLCGFAFYITNHPRIKTYATYWGHQVLPYFLIALGLYILKDFFSALL